MGHPRITWRLRRLTCSCLLLFIPWLPGLLALPMLATSRPVLGRDLTPAPTATAPARVTAPDASANSATAGADAVGQPAPAAEAFLPATPLQPGEVWVQVDLGQQRVRVYKEQELLREMIASAGRPESPTPVGSFKLQNRGDWFFSEKFQQGGFFWVSFLNWGEYLFHSVPTDRGRRILPEEAVLLGQPASHGCIRLSLEDARWFYENLSEGTRVEIHT